MKPLYLMDTNVLVNWAIHGTNHGQTGWWTEWFEPCAKFCRNPNHEIVIPTVVWSELHGVMLQKDLDLDDLDHWFRNKRSLIQKITRMVTREEHRFTFHSGFDPQVIQQLCNIEPSRKIIRRLQNARRRAEQRAREEGKTNFRFNAKLLDGVDSAILATAISVAKAAPEREVKLVTRDSGLGMMNDFIVNNPDRVGSLVVPPNLKTQKSWSQVTSRNQQRRHMAGRRRGQNEERDGGGWS